MLRGIEPLGIPHSAFRIPHSELKHKLSSHAAIERALVSQLRGGDVLHRKSQ